MGTAGQRAWRDAPSPAAFERMRARSSGRDRLVLYLLGKVGLRSGEVVVLEPDDLDLEDGSLDVPGTKTRFARRTLPLRRFHPVVWNGLVAWFELEDHMEPRSTAGVRALVKRLSPPGRPVYPHALRARAAYDMARALHGDAVKLCAWMGWRSLSEADAYVRASGAVLFD